MKLASLNYTQRPTLLITLVLNSQERKNTCLAFYYQQLG